MNAGRPRGEEGGHPPFVVGPDPRGAGVQPDTRDSDLGHPDLPAGGARRIDEVADLRRRERHREIGVETKIGRGPRVGRKAGRDVHGDPDRVAEPSDVIQVGDHPGGEPPERARTPRPQDRVHDDPGAGSGESVRSRMAERPFPGGFVGAGNHVERELHRGLVVRLRLSGEPFRIGQEHGGAAQPASRQRPERHQAVAPVAAAPAEDENPAAARPRLGGDDVGDRPPRVLHQDARRNPGLLDRVAVRVAHLLRGQHVHGVHCRKGTPLPPRPVLRLPFRQ